MRALPRTPRNSYPGTVGGVAVSFGSDAHEPDQVGGGFKLATKVVEAGGFKPAADPVALWRR